MRPKKLQDECHVIFLSKGVKGISINEFKYMFCFKPRFHAWAQFSKKTDCNLYLEATPVPLLSSKY